MTKKLIPTMVDRSNVKQNAEGRNQFDAIVVGSGIGGLAVAGILAKLNHKRVLVLEKHFTLGGLTHEFSRGKYQWDVGLHYVGEIGQGELAKNVFDYLTDAQLKWTKMPPTFERFYYPDFTVQVPSDPQKYRDSLVAMFPSEKGAILTYFKDVKHVAAWYKKYIVKKSLPRVASFLLDLFSYGKKRVALLSVKKYLDAHFQDERLKAVLVSQWGDYGLCPSQASFAIHALIVSHYLQGGYFPVGGASSIVKWITPIIERMGGALLANQKVTSLIAEHGVVKGVRTSYPNGPESGQAEFYAPVVISNIGALETYEKLLKPFVPIPDGIESLPVGLSAVTLYVGLKQSPQILNIQGENLWIYSSYDHDQIAERSTTPLNGNPQHCYVSFPSLKNPQARAHTAEIISFVSYDQFAAFAKNPWLRRQPEYYDLKTKVTKGLLNLVEKRVPGFSELIEYTELSTPLSMEFFTSRIQGLMYGIPAVPKRYTVPWLSIKTPLRNFFLSGSDISAPGIVGALMGGIACAGVLNGPLGFIKIIYAVTKESKTRKPMSGTNAEVSLQPFWRKQLMPGEVLGRLKSRRQLAGTFYELTFTLQNKIQFVAGQHMYLRVAPSEWRPYDIVNVSEQDATFIIDVSPGGLGSQFALQCPLGKEIFMRGPKGTFCLQDTSSREKIFIATGSGITPFFPMLRQLADHSCGEKIRLLWGIRNKNHDFSSVYLQGIAEKMSFEMTTCVSEPTMGGNFYSGRVTEKLRALPLDFARTDFYLCGNPGMIDELHTFLRSKKAANAFFEL